jgi:regulatory protein
LRRKLLDKGYDAGILTGVIERLIAERLIDDRRYVENFVVYHAARGQGPLRVALQLRQVGLTGEIVESALANFPEWSLKMQEARRKKFGAALPSEYAERQRQARFLQFRGFTSAQIRAGLGFDTDLNEHDDTL